MSRPTSVEQHNNNENTATKQSKTFFEKRLSSSKLLEFKNSGKVWMSDTRDENLFYFWEEFKNESVNVQPNMNKTPAIEITFNDEFWLANKNLLDCTIDDDGIVILPKKILTPENTPAVLENNLIVQNKPIENSDQQPSCSYSAFQEGFPTPFKNSFYYPEPPGKKVVRKNKPSMHLHLINILNI